MNYYIIRSSLNVKIIGHYPQVKEIKHNCHVWDDPNFVEHLHFKKADFDPITANAILYNKSKVTDLIDAVGMGFTKKLLVSGKLKNIILAYRQSCVQFFQSGIYYKNNLIEDYWILNVFEINMEAIDYEKSSFVFRKKKPEGGTYLEQVKINSFNDFEKVLVKKEEFNYTQFFIENVVLKKNITKDFFVLLHVEGGVKYIVSEKLKKEIEDTRCTGIEFMPVEIKLSEWLQGGEREKIYGIK